MVRSFQVRSVNTFVCVPIATRTQISFKRLRNIYYICGTNWPFWRTKWLFCGTIWPWNDMTANHYLDSLTSIYIFAALDSRWTIFNLSCTKRQYGREWIFSSSLWVAFVQVPCQLLMEYSETWDVTPSHQLLVETANTHGTKRRFIILPCHSQWCESFYGFWRSPKM